MSIFLFINFFLSSFFWTTQEENLLLDLVKKHGKNWAKIAVLFKTRSGKQIRDHFYYCMDGNKNNFTEEEDDKIKSLFLEYGNKFSKFPQYLPGRSGESIKNRFHSSIKKKLLKKKLMNKNMLMIKSKGNKLV